MQTAGALEASPRPEATPAMFGSRPRGYLEIFNLFRVVACLAVIGQHAFIWTDMSDNFVGTGFITVLHLSRTCFFFLTGLVVCYAQITHPRPLLGFWRRRYVEVGVPYLAWTGIYLVFTLITVDASWNEAGAFLRHDLPYGFSQMYFVIVIFQFSLLFPLLWQLLRVTRHHGPVLAVRLGLALASELFQHYPTLFTDGNRVTHSLKFLLPGQPGLPQLSGVLRGRHARGAPSRPGGRVRRPSPPPDSGDGRHRRRGRGALVRALGLARRLARPGL